MMFVYTNLQNRLTNFDDILYMCIIWSNIENKIVIYFDK